MLRLSFKYIIITLISVTILKSNVYSQETGEWYEAGEYYGLYRADPDVPLIESINMNDCVASIFPGGYVIKRDFYESGYIYTYIHTYAERKQVLLTFGLYPSVRATEEWVLFYLTLVDPNNLSYSSPDNVIGDNSWYENSAHANRSIIIYKNLFFSLTLLGIEKEEMDAENYTRALVEKIHAGADFVTIKDTIAVPEIVSLTPSKQAVALGDTCSIRAEVFDPLNRPLQLGGSEPLISEKTFYFEKNTTEPEEFKAYAITDGYLYSEMETITIGF